MLSPLYLAEISPPEVRGSLMALEQFAIVLGVVLGFLAGYFSRNSMLLRLVLRCPKHAMNSIYFVSPCLSRIVDGSISWRLPLAIQVIPALILSFGSLFLPPSPRLLISQGKQEEARKALARLRLRVCNEEETDPLLRVRYTSHASTSDSSYENP
jgi:MFS family permease